MKRVLLIFTLLIGFANCWGQDVNYVLYRSTNYTNAYYNHLKTGCSATITSVPISIDWTINNGTELSSNNYALLGSFSTTDNCTSRSTIDIECDLSKFEGGVSYLVEFDNNSGTTTKTLQNDNGIVLVTTTSSYANGSFTVGITPRRPNNIIKYDTINQCTTALILTQDEKVYLFTESKDLPFPLNSAYTYQIDWRADSIDIWKTINKFPFTVPYTELTKPTKYGKKIFFRSRIIRNSGSVAKTASPLEIKRNNESLNLFTETLPTTDYDPVIYSPFYESEIFVEVRKKPDVELVSIDSCYCKQNSTIGHFNIKSIYPGDSLKIWRKDKLVDVILSKLVKDTSNLCINLLPGSNELYYEYLRKLNYGMSILFASSNTIKISPLPRTIKVSSSTNNVSCFGWNNGQINVTATNGFPPYTYSLDGTETRSGTKDSIFRNLIKGSYNVTVIDTNGCTGTKSSINITQPTKLTLGAPVIKNVNCKDGSDGKIEFKVKGGTKPYNFTPSGGNISTATIKDSIYSGLIAASNYAVTVTDTNRCAETLTGIIVSEPKDSLKVLVYKTDNVKCFGNSDGYVTLQASGGTRGYKYSLDNATWKTDSTFSGLAKNSYIFYVQDTNGCNANVSQKITQPNQLTLSVDTIKKLTCYRKMDGEVWLIAIGGTKNYQFSKDGQNWQPDSVFSFLEAKNYTFHINDSKGCTSSLIVNVTQPDSLKLSVKKSGNVLCNGGNTGYVTLEASGGTLPYSYSNGGIDWASSATFNELSNGEYTFNVNDKNGCQQSVSKTIVEPTILTSSTSKVDVICYGSANGSITVSASGGTPPYSFSNDDGNSFTVASTPHTFTGLSSANYKIVVKDANDCMTNAINEFVSQPTYPLSATANFVNVTCYGFNNGEITVNASGGTSPYSYSIDNGENFSSSNQFQNLSPATYQVVVKDSKGCMVYLTPKTITQPSAALSATFSQRDIFCYGAKDGEITINTAGGTSPYKYSKDNGHTFTDLSESVPYNLTGLDAATYTIVVQDVNGCVTDPFDVSIVQPTQEYKFSISNAVNVKCFGGSDGSVELKAEGGTPFTGNSYLYSMDGHNWNPSSDAYRFDALSARTDTFRVQDSNGCKLSVIHKVTQPNEINPNASISNVVCKGESNGSISFTVSGGTPIYSLDFFNSKGTIGSMSNVSSKVGFANLGSGVYKLRVTDNAGCVKIDSFNVQEPINNLGFTVNSLQPQCKGLANGNIEIIATGGWGTYTYSNTLSANKTGLFNNLKAGDYQLSVIDLGGCIANSTFTLSEPDSLKLKVEKISNLTCYGNGTGNIDFDATGGTPVYSYSLFGDLISPTTSADGIFANLPASNSYRIKVFDSHGCVDSSMVTITQPDSLKIKVSNRNGTIVNCPGNRDTIWVAPYGGTLPYTLAPECGTGANYLSKGFALCNQPDGVYRFTIYDKNGCSKADSAIISSIPGPSVSLDSIVNATCDNVANGSIAISITTHAGIKSILWDVLGARDTLLTNLYKGEYKVMVTDNNSCAFRTSFSVNAPPPITFSLFKHRDPKCFGFADGNLSVSTSGGNGVPYSYQWLNSKSETVSQVDSTGAIPSGVYSVVVLDAKGCQNSATYTIVDPPSVTPKLPETVTICANQTYVVDAGIPNVSYQWSSDNGFTSTLKVDTLKQPGNYYLTIIDANGCVGQDTLKVEGSSSKIDANFMVAELASVGDTLVIIEMSWPAPEAIEWLYPAAFTSVYHNDYSIYLVPQMEGTFNIGLTSYVGPCSEYIEKTIVIVAAKGDEGKTSTAEPLIKDVKLFPNPNKGDFSVDVYLSREAETLVELYSIYGQRIRFERVTGLSKYSVNINQRLLPGIYLVRVTAGSETRSLRVVVQ